MDYFEVFVHASNGHCLHALRFATNSARLNVNYCVTLESQKFVRVLMSQKFVRVLNYNYSIVEGVGLKERGPCVICGGAARLLACI